MLYLASERINFLIKRHQLFYFVDHVLSDTFHGNHSTKNSLILLRNPPLIIHRQLEEPLVSLEPYLPTP